MISVFQTFRKYFILPGFLLLFLPGPVMSYVLPGPHILELMTASIKKPTGLVVYQKRTVMKVQEPENLHLDIQEPEDPLVYIVEPEDPGIYIQEPEVLQIDIQETLWYSFPGNFRSESVSDAHEKISVFSDGNYLVISNGTLVAKKESPAERYTDILLFRDRVSLEQRLESSGIDVNVSSLQRYENTICYVVGDLRDKKNPASSLWVDKETFFPVRYIVRKNNWDVEIVYRNWHKVSRTWYPMEISIFLDKTPFSLINVNYFELKSNISRSLFDIDQLMTIYPESKGFQVEDEPESADDIQQSIQDFKRLYE